MLFDECGEIVELDQCQRNVRAFSLILRLFGEATCAHIDSRDHLAVTRRQNFGFPETPFECLVGV